jgi:hypothetical protein
MTITLRAMKPIISFRSIRTTANRHKMPRQFVQNTSSRAQLRENLSENSGLPAERDHSTLKFVIFRLRNDAIPDNKIVLERSFKFSALASSVM